MIRAGDFKPPPHISPCRLACLCPDCCRAWFPSDSLWLRARSREALLLTLWPGIKAGLGLFHLPSLLQTPSTSTHASLFTVIIIILTLSLLNVLSVPHFVSRYPLSFLNLPPPVTPGPVRHDPGSCLDPDLHTSRHGHAPPRPQDVPAHGARHQGQDRPGPRHE